MAERRDAASAPPPPSRLSQATIFPTSATSLSTFRRATTSSPSALTPFSICTTARISSTAHLVHPRPHLGSARARRRGHRSRRSGAADHRRHLQHRRPPTGRVHARARLEDGRRRSGAIRADAHARDCCPGSPRNIACAPSANSPAWAARRSAGWCRFISACAMQIVSASWPCFRRASGGTTRASSAT